MAFRHDDTAGVVLAGGLARRMGGGDKPLRALGGRTLLDRVLAVLLPSVAAVAVNANGDPQRFAAWGLPVLTDPLPDHPGPLAGVLAAMNWAAEQGLPWVVTVPGDCPFLPIDLVDRLHQARTAAGGTIACAASAGVRHPPVAVWSVTLRDDLRRALNNGEGKVSRWADRHGAGVAEWPSMPQDPFLNLNTPAELAAAEAWLAETPPPGP